MIENINIDYKIIAKHFNKTNQNMWVSKDKYFKSKDTDEKHGIWDVYVKAYNYDMSNPGTQQGPKYNMSNPIGSNYDMNHKPIPDFGDVVESDWTRTIESPQETGFSSLQESSWPQYQQKPQKLLYYFMHVRYYD